MSDYLRDLAARAAGIAPAAPLLAPAADRAFAPLPGLVVDPFAAEEALETVWPVAAAAPPPVTPPAAHPAPPAWAPATGGWAEAPSATTRPALTPVVPAPAEQLATRSEQVAWPPPPDPIAWAVSRPAREEPPRPAPAEGDGPPVIERRLVEGGWWRPPAPDNDALAPAAPPTGRAGAATHRAEIAAEGREVQRVEMVPPVAVPAAVPRELRSAVAILAPVPPQIPPPAPRPAPALTIGRLTVEVVPSPTPAPAPPAPAPRRRAAPTGREPVARSPLRFGLGQM